MNPQLSQDYKVDARYKGGRGTIDNTAANRFLRGYLDLMRVAGSPNQDAELASEDRFIVSGPGDSKYSFRNDFKAK
jgi:hypothetical protein